MTASNIRLVLMPGLDGTGELFESFRAELPPAIEIVTLRYPQDRVRGYAELRPAVIQACEGAAKVVLFAESFSSPLAIEIAAAGLKNLSGVILCAGFAAPPVDRVAGIFLRRVPASLFRLPQWAIRRYLVGPNAPVALVQKVRRTIASVPPHIILHRLNEVFTHSAMESVARVQVPMLYIQASDDRLVPDTAFGRIASANDKLIHRVVTGPHLLAQANPTGVAAAVVTFIHTLA